MPSMNTMEKTKPYKIKTRRRRRSWPWWWP